MIAEPLLDKKIILYTGTVNDHLCIKELVQTFDRVNDERCALVITGMKDNTYCNEIRAFVKQCKTSDRIVLFPHLTRTEMLSLQANADIGVCLAKEYSDNVESKMMAPNKVGEYLAKGLYLFSINNEYMVPFAMKGIASLSQSTSIADMSIALKDALIAVNDDQSKITISNFVKDYFCMQKQLKPVIDYLSTL